MDFSTPASIIEQGASIRQRRIDSILGNLAQDAANAKICAPAILVIGNTAKMHFCDTNLPLCGKNIGIAGSANFVKKLCSSIERSTGAVILPCPSLSIKANEDFSFPDFIPGDWIFFTSSNAVRSFFFLASKRRWDLRRLCGVKFAVTADGTAKTLAEYGFYADFMPSFANGESLARDFIDFQGKNLNKTNCIYLLRTESAAKELPLIFDESKIFYKDMAIYSSSRDTELLELLQKNLLYLDFLVLSSVESANGVFDFCSQQINSNPNLKFICLGKKCFEHSLKFAPGRCIFSPDFSADSIIQLAQE
jgi:uroporphyrinogen III methyltransferase/synthase